MNIPLETQFSIASFKAQVQQMTPDQMDALKGLTIEIFTQAAIREAYYKELLRKHWGI